jgi:hypothetical protein
LKEFDYKLCEKCRANHKQAMIQANAHMDELGIPADSVLRGMADIQLACNAHPILSALMRHCWPSEETLLEQPVGYGFMAMDQ